ncbi:MAG: enoyl-CoA hydratase/isomerase family protein [bacterium]
MTLVFDYKTLHVTLDPSTRSLTIELSRPARRNAITMEMLFELEGMMAWLSSHLEINAVILRGAGGYFSAGFDREETARMDAAKLQKYFKKLQKIVYSMHLLPQTFIVDLGKGAEAQGLELALGGDIRVVHEETVLEFNHLQKGLVPCSGGVGILAALVGTQVARRWVMTSQTLTANDAVSGNFADYSYVLQTKYKQQQEILKRILMQSPVTRIQAKRSMVETVLPEFDRSLVYESNFAHAGMATGDWKKFLENIENDEERLIKSTDYTNPRDMAKIVKEVSPTN